MAQIIPCSIEDTHDDAAEAVRWEAASRFESPNFPAETERRLRVARYRQAGGTLPLIRPQARHQAQKALALFAKA